MKETNVTPKKEVLFQCSEIGRKRTVILFSCKSTTGQIPWLNLSASVFALCSRASELEWVREGF